MRVLLFVLLMVQLLFAQTTGSIGQAIDNLTEMTQSFLFLLHTILCFPGLILGAIGAIIYFLKVRKKERPGLWKWAAIIIGGLGILGIIGGILILIIVALTPFLIKEVLIGDVPG